MFHGLVSIEQHSIQDLAAGVRLNRYNWTLVENELHAKRNYCIEVFRLALDSNLVDKLQQSIDQLQLPIIIKQTSRTMVARWNEWWQNRINYRWISNRLQTIRVWAQNWLQWMDQIARHFIQTINQYNGNVFEMLHDMRRKYLLQVQRALDRLVLNALDWCAQALSNVQSWLMHKSLPIVQNQLNSLVVRLHAEVKRQQAAVVEHEFDYTRKVLHILSAIMPSRAWFEAPNELTWRPDRGEFTLVIRTNST